MREEAKRDEGEFSSLLRASALETGREHVLVRFALLRLLGLVYLVAFLVAAFQLVPLIGEHGLEPATVFLARLVEQFGSKRAAFAELPTLFWAIAPTDGALLAVSWIGVVLSALLFLGAENAILNLVLWALYLSIVQIGQTFYGFGWESQLCETGLLAVFLCPARTIAPFASPPPIVAIWLQRWLIVRVMLGAGLIKLRGDACWRELTCLTWHYETQPNPSPASWVLNAMPKWFQEAGVLVNHLVELVAPFFAFGPRRARLVAGTLFVAFQSMLIVSGNLSFLNWLTIVPAIACFDDRFLASFVPRRLRGTAPWLSARLATMPSEPSRPLRIAAWAWAAVVAFLSIRVVMNLLSPEQVMNTSFDSLHLVSTYGAFGSVGKERDEVIVEGTRDETPGPDTVWLEYEFPCKPGDPKRRPCQITPYHYRLDWQMWFAAMSDPVQEPWLVHFVAKLLEGDRRMDALLAKDPFPDAPPRWVRLDLYRYHFTRPGDGSHAWWRRERIGTYLKPLRRDDPRLVDYLHAYGWTD